MLKVAPSDEAGERDLNILREECGRLNSNWHLLSPKKAKLLRLLTEKKN